MKKSQLIVFIAYYLFSVVVMAVENQPPPEHLLIVVEENRAFTSIVGNPDAPFINSLLPHGLLFTAAHGVTHPSQPNYLALFSGSTHGVPDNRCPLQLSGTNLASALLAKGLTFMSYAESMPEPGYLGCEVGAYRRKHNPIANWPALAALNQPFSAFPTDFTQLPTVALLVPDQLNDMHDGSIAQGDRWLAQHIQSYAKWAVAHHSLLLLTWDEDDGLHGNQVVTLLLGAGIKAGTSAQLINHYSILRFISELYALPYLGESATQTSITGIR